MTERPVGATESGARDADHAAKRYLEVSEKRGRESDAAEKSG